ncbi:MAG: hypothetical protein NC924_07135, partial [Candidatus Omnitrophica bacterium]|nr:hypothetical protein [Candidatus Omnitrophota bacterium]
VTPAEIASRLDDLFGYSYNRNDLEIATARQKITLLEIQLSMLEKGENWNLEIPLGQLMMAANGMPMPLAWWAGSKALSWFGTLMLSNDKSPAEIKKQLVRKELAAAHDELQRVSNQARLRQQQAGAALRAGAEQEQPDAARLRDALAARQNGISVAAAEPRDGKTRVYSMEGLVTAAIVNDARVQESFARMERGALLKDGAPVASRGDDGGGVIFSRDGPVAYSVMSLFPAQAAADGKLSPLRESLLRDSARADFDVAVEQVSARVITALYRLAFINDARQKLTGAKIQATLKAQEQDVRKELARLIGDDAALEIDDLKRLSLSAAGLGGNNALALTSLPQVKAAEARVNDKVAAVRDIVAEFARLRSQTTLAHVQTKSKDEARIGVHYTTPTTAEIVQRLQPVVGQLLTDALSAQQTATRMAAATVRAIEDMAAAQEELQAAQRLLASFHAEYLSGDEPEETLRQYDVAVQHYFDALTRFEANYQRVRGTFALMDVELSQDLTAGTQKSADVPLVQLPLAELSRIAALKPEQLRKAGLPSTAEARRHFQIKLNEANVFWNNFASEVGGERATTAATIQHLYAEVMEQYPDVVRALFSDGNAYPVVNEFVRSRVLPLYEKMALLLVDPSTDDHLRASIINFAGEDVLAYQVLSAYPQPVREAYFTERLVRTVGRSAADMLGKLGGTAGQKNEINDFIRALNNWRLDDAVYERFGVKRAAIEAQILAEADHWAKGHYQRVDKNPETMPDAEIYVNNPATLRLQTEYLQTKQKIEAGERERQIKATLKKEGLQLAVVNTTMENRNAWVRGADGRELKFKDDKDLESSALRNNWRFVFYEEESLYGTPNPLSRGRQLDKSELAAFERVGKPYQTVLVDGSGRELGKLIATVDALNSKVDKTLAYREAQVRQAEAMNSAPFDGLFVVMKPTKFPGMWDEKVTGQPWSGKNQDGYLSAAEFIAARDEKGDFLVTADKHHVTYLHLRALNQDGTPRLDAQGKEIMYDVVAYKYVGRDLVPVSPAEEDVIFIIQDEAIRNGGNPENGQRVLPCRRALEKSLANVVYGDFLTRWNITNLQKSLKVSKDYAVFNSLLGPLGSVSNAPTVGISKLLFNLYSGLTGVGLPQAPSESDIADFFQAAWGRLDYPASIRSPAYIAAYLHNLGSQDAAPDSPLSKFFRSQWPDTRAADAPQYGDGYQAFHRFVREAPPAEDAVKRAAYVNGAYAAAEQRVLAGKVLDFIDTVAKATAIARTDEAFVRGMYEFFHNPNMETGDNYKEFLDFVTNAPVGDEKSLHEYLKKNFSTDKKIAYAKYVLFVLDNLAEITGVDRNHQGLLQGVFAFFRGTEVNLLSLAGLAGGTKWLGRGFKNDLRGLDRLAPAFGITLDVSGIAKDILDIESLDPSVISSVDLRAYIMGQVQFEDDKQAREYLSRLANSYAFGIVKEESRKGWNILDWFRKSAAKGQLGTNFNSRDEFKRANLRQVGRVKLAKTGENLPVFINRIPGIDPKTGEETYREEVIIFGLKGYRDQAQHVTRQLRDYDTYVRGQVAEGLSIPKLHKLAEPVTPEQVRFEDSALDAQQLYNFITRSRNEHTGTIDEYFTPAYKEMPRTAGDGSSYANALYAQYLYKIGDQTQANGITSFLSQTPQLQLFPAANAQAKEFLGLANRFHTGDPAGLPTEYLAHSGPQAFVGMSLLQAYEQSGDERYLQQAILLYSVLAQRQSSDNGGITQGHPGIETPKGVKIREGTGAVQHLFQVQSGEENVDVRKFLRDLERVLKTMPGKRYRETLSDIQDNRRIEKTTDMLYRLYNPAKNRFERGMQLINGKWQQDGVFALDVTNLLVLEETPEAIAKRIGSEQLIALWRQKERDEAQGGTLVTKEVRCPDGKTVTVTLHDWTDRAGRGERDAVGFLEITAQDALAHLEMARYFQSLGRTQDAQQERRQYQEHMENINKLKVTVAGRGAVLPASTDMQVRVFADSPEGMEIPQHFGNLAATTWALFAHIGYNPFRERDLAGGAAPDVKLHPQPLPAGRLVQAARQTQPLMMQSGAEAIDLTVEYVERLAKDQPIAPSPTQEYLISCDPEKGIYWIWDPKYMAVKQITLVSDAARAHKIAALLELKREYALAVERSAEAAQGDLGGVELTTFDGRPFRLSDGKPAVLVGRNWLLEQLNRIDQYPHDQRLAIERRGWVYAGTLGDILGTSDPTPIRVRLLFPSGDWQRERVNPATGVQETIFNKKGIGTTRIETDKFIQAFSYNEKGIVMEVITTDRRGRVMEVRKAIGQDVKRGTITYEVYVPDLNRRTIEVFSEKGIDPLWSIDDYEVRYTTHDRYGLYSKSKGWGRVQGIAAVRRDRLGWEDSVESRDLQTHELTTVRRNLHNETSKKITQDMDYLGRTKRTEIAGSNRIYEQRYNPDRYLGLISELTTVRSRRTNAVVGYIGDFTYDPATKKTTGREFDVVRLNGFDTAKRGYDDVRNKEPIRKVWNDRGDLVEMHRAGRSTFLRTNLYNTESSAEKFVNDPGSPEHGERVEESKSRFVKSTDTSAGHWVRDITYWHLYTDAEKIPLYWQQMKLDPYQIEQHTDTWLMDGSGRKKLIERLIPQFNDDTYEESRASWLRDEAGEDFSIPYHNYDQYEWHDNILTRRVDAGTPYRMVQKIDAYGRDFETRHGDGVLAAVTNTTSFEGASNRRRETVLAVNGHERARTMFEPVDAAARTQRQIVRQKFGLDKSQTVSLGDPFARPFDIAFENGTTLIVDQWAPYRNAPLLTREFDRNGRERGKKVFREFITNNDLSLSLVEEQECTLFGDWFIKSQAAFIAGTPVPFFTVDGYEKTFWDMESSYEAPQLSIDVRGGEYGKTVDDVALLAPYFQRIDPAVVRRAAGALKVSLADDAVEEVIKAIRGGVQTVIQKSPAARAQSLVDYLAQQLSAARLIPDLLVARQLVMNIFSEYHAALGLGVDGLYLNNVIAIYEHGRAEYSGDNTAQKPEEVLRVTGIHFGGRLKNEQISRQAFGRDGKALEELNGPYIAPPGIVNFAGIFEELKEAVFAQRSEILYNPGYLIYQDIAGGRWAYSETTTGRRGGPDADIPVNEAGYREFETGRMFTRNRQPVKESITPRLPRPSGRQAAAAEMGNNWLPEAKTENYTVDREHAMMPALRHPYYQQQDKIFYTNRFNISFDEKIPLPPAERGYSRGGEVSWNGRQLLVEGKPWQIRGTTLSITPRGQPYDDHTPLDFSTVTRDMVRRMREDGINTVRTYKPVAPELMQEFQRNGIKVIAHLKLDFHNNVATLISQAKQQVTAMGNHPAVLFWELGNEENYTYRGSEVELYQKINAVAAAIKQADPNHPVSVAHGELPSPEVLAAAPQVDVWGLNSYRWDSLREVINHWRQLSDKPMYFSETGADSLDNASYNQDWGSQAVTAYRLWQDIDARSTVHDPDDACLGATFMTQQDELWKGGALGEYRAGGQELPVFPDNFGNEAHWGWYTVDGEPKTVAELMKRVWRHVPLGVKFAAASGVPGVTLDVDPTPVKRMEQRNWFDHRGNPAMTVSKGLGYTGETKKHTYYLPEFMPRLAESMSFSLLTKPSSLQWDSLAEGIFAGNDYVYFYTKGAAAPKLIFKDAAGKRVVVAPENGDMAFWAPIVPNLVFYPDAVAPETTVSVVAEPRDLRAGRIWSVSLAELQKKIDLARITSAEVLVDALTEPEAFVSDLGILGDGSRNFKAVEQTRVVRLDWGNGLTQPTLRATVEYPDGNKSTHVSRGNKPANLTLTDPVPNLNPLSRGARDPRTTVIIEDNERAQIAADYWTDSGYQLSAVKVILPDKNNGTIVLSFGVLNGFQSPMITSYDIEYLTEGEPTYVAVGADNFVTFPQNINILASNMGQNYFVEISERLLNALE